MLLTNFKVIWRKLWKNSTISAINIGNLSIGMTAFVLITLWVDNEIGHDNYHEDASDIYSIVNHFKEKGDEQSYKWESSPYPLGEAAKSEIPEITAVTRILPLKYQPPVLNINGLLFREKNCAYVDSAWFNFFKYKFIHGNPASFVQHPFNLLLTERAVKKYFGNANPVGTIVRIDTANYTVAAVIENNPSNSSFQFDVLIPLAARSSNPQAFRRISHWGGFSYITFVKLHPNADPQAASQKLTAIYNKQNKKDIAASLLPLKDLHFEQDWKSVTLAHGNREMVYIFSILGILLLAIACINYVNLVTAQASIRSKEISIKKIMGAERRHLFGQFFLETFLTSALALLISVCLIQLAFPFFKSLTEKNFYFPFTSLKLWAVLGGTLLITLVLSGIYPAVLLSSFKPVNILRGFNILRMKDTTLRKALVVVQFVISIGMIAATMIIYLQLTFIKDQYAGYERSQIFSVSLPFKWLKHNDTARATILSSLKQKLTQSAGIEMVTMSDQNIMDIKGTSSESVDWEGRKPDANINVSQVSVDEDFQKMFHLQLKEGRWFRDNKSDEPNIVLNETAVNMFNLQQPVIGKRFVFMNKPGVIIGIAKDFPYRSLYEKNGPLVMFVNKSWAPYLFIKTSSGNTPLALQSAQQAWKEFIPDEPFEYTFMDETFDTLYRSDIKASGLMFLFSLVAIIIACLGLFGLTVFATEKRIKEIGIRKVLGANTFNITNLLSKEFILLICIAAVFSIPITWWATQDWLEEFAYRINVPWWIFALSGLITILIAFFTVGYQARRAILSNPVNSLRAE